MNWIHLLSAQRPDGKPADPHATRSAFEQDFDRIIFSSPFRRLQDKTQVFPLPKEDFVHTRLTHSLEVSSVGRSLGKRAGEVLVQRYTELQEVGITQFDFGAVVAAAALTHDIGNPPFGHCGESAISDFFKNAEIEGLLREHCSPAEWADLTNFEGNAQGFRILNKASNTGLRLTYATLAAFSKYPCQSLLHNRNKKQVSQKKYGFFQSEKGTFTEVARATGLHPIAGETAAWKRHPLAFLVEAADDICYHLIDLEDGCRMGLISFEETVAFLASILQERFKPEKLQQIRGQEEQLGVLRSLAIGTLIDQTTTTFLEHERAMLQGDFETALADLIPARETLAAIKKRSVEKIYRSQPVLETEIAGFEVLAGLLDAFVKAGFYHQFAPEKFSARHTSVLRLMPEQYRPINDMSVYELVMNCLDFISGLTDRHAVSLYRKIKGNALPVL
ncbi:deoxyguanosinetriphosphate triphosphohydrolase [Flammeovirgaceae bacterium 311]|nr:deoxyguanosinetriphosphate triphosphohydrolase [Flammeovirgaceae bacterium 311]